MNELYMIYNKTTGEIFGFYNDSEVSKDVIAQEHNLDFIAISNDIHEWIFDSGIRLVTVDVNAIKEFDGRSVLNDKGYFIVNDPIEIIDINAVKYGLIAHMKSECRKYIVRGFPVTFSNGDVKHFSFKMEDQINLKDLIATKTKGDNCYYHADGEKNTHYSYDDICLIYRCLYNNKLFNQVYTQVLCEWIQNNYSEDTYHDPDIMMEYGFSNNYILEETERIYNEQKLL